VRIICLNRFYWPDETATAQLLTDLATGLAARGHSVTVIASRPVDSLTPSVETKAGVLIMRVGGTRWGRRRLSGRAVDFATFLVAACWRLARTAQRGDVIIAMTDPPLLGVVVWPIARLKGARCVHWVQDIYPEVATALSGSPLIHVLGAILRPLRNFTWRRSAGCVALGEDMAGFIRQMGVPSGTISVIPNWAPEGLEEQSAAAGAALRHTWGLQDKFVVAYSGNLGRVHDLDPVLALAGVLKDAARIAFVFVGGGAQRAALEQRATALGLANVHFQPAQPRQRLAETLAVGDIHLVTLHSGCAAFVFPSKLYGIAAVGRPMIFIGPRDCEPARIVTGQNLGFAFTRDEVDAMANALRQLAADPGRQAAAGRAAAAFSRSEGRLDHGLELWLQFLGRDAAC
jgi:glycosyltransferase involved in cell wall biosynthesis